jgi:hypothetical protein
MKGSGPLGGPDFTRSSLPQPNIDAAVLGAGPAPIVRIREESVMTARRRVRMILAIPVDVTAMVVTLTFIMRAMLRPALIVVPGLIVVARLVIGPLILR